MTEERVIIHVDMDAFFAAIEQRDDPALRGRPVVVGADPGGGGGRGVVSTCSYEAREYGIRSAQPISEAYRRCPHAVFLPVDGEKYRRESRRIRDILIEFTPQIQFVSIDEAFLDVTGSLRIFGERRHIAELIRWRIQEESGLTASLGVAPNKLVAKIGSDLEKPRGLVVVDPGQVEEFLGPLPVGRLPGVGPKLRDTLEAMGIRTIGDLAAVPREELERRFGEHGKDLWRKARGQDDGPVEGSDEAKSIGHEHTFGEDTDDWARVDRKLMELCEKVARRLRKAGERGHTVTTKVRFEDFSTVTRQTTFDAPVFEAGQLHAAAVANFEAADARGRKVRLIGVQVSGFDSQREGARQLSLFAEDAERGRDDIRLRIARAEDAVKDRFGDEALRRGASFPDQANPGSRD